MKIREIQFRDDQTPGEVTLTITARELYILGRAVGGTNDLNRNETHPGWGPVGSDFYDLACQVANAYFEGGLQDHDLEIQL